MAEAQCNNTISVVIPVHDGGEAFERCLAAVARTSPQPAEVIVVVDGDPQMQVQPRLAQVTQVLRLPERYGPAAARNAGARAASGQILMFVDSDVVLPPEAVGIVDDVLTGEPELTAVFGLYDDDPPRVNFLSQYKNLSHHFFHLRAPEEASTFWAGCGAIRRAEFLAAGGFDADYGRPCVEDIELGYRLKRAGRRIRLCKRLRVKHLKVWTLRKLLKTEVFDRAVPWTQSILRYRDVAGGPNLGRASRLSVVSAYGLVAAALGGIWWRGSLAIAAAFLAVLLAANARLYVLFLRRRGVLFMLGGVVWNWFYYLYGGLGFAVGLGLHVLGRRRRRADEVGAGPAG